MKEEKSKAIAGVLGILLGSLGIHHLYLGRVGTGMLYLLLTVLLCWTFVVPVIFGIIGLVEGITYLCMSDEDFNKKYNA